ncbi:MAG: Na+/H+ antiporter NhaA [Anaerolineales bacterium]|nr:Na+/H+ antiporter NhaA [Anaerolineales bacterium]
MRDDKLKYSNNTLQPKVILKNSPDFLNSDLVSAAVLVLATLAALIAANGPTSGGYDAVFDTSLRLNFGPWDVKQTVREWANALLMAIFFFSVGLEIKQELVAGSLSSRRSALMPAAGALGGMVIPGLIFIFLNRGQETITGWAIPMATDPAFTIAILSTLRKQVPQGLRALILALAVVDDIGATIVIALVYHHGLKLSPLMIILAISSLLLLMNRAGVQRLLFYFLVGGVLWVVFLDSGIHTSVGGVLLAMMIPAEKKGEGKGSLLVDVERSLSPWIKYLILPLFAFCNAGIYLREISLIQSLQSSVFSGSFWGLVAGKPAGILLFSSLAVLLGAAHLPRGIRWSHVAGGGFLSGIGFTTSIFLAGLAFGGGSAYKQSVLAILLASSVAALVGSVILIMIPSGDERGDGR